MWSSVTDFIPTVSNQPPSTGKDDNTGLVVGIVVGVGTVCLVGFCVVFLIVQKRRRQRALEDEGKQKIIIYVFSLPNTTQATFQTNPDSYIFQYVTLFSFILICSGGFLD